MSLAESFGSNHRISAAACLYLLLVSITTAHRPLYSFYNMWPAAPQDWALEPSSIPHNWYRIEAGIPWNGRRPIWEARYDSKWLCTMIMDVSMVYILGYLSARRLWLIMCGCRCYQVGRALNSREKLDPVDLGGGWQSRGIRQIGQSNYDFIVQLWAMRNIDN